MKEFLKGFWYGIVLGLSVLGLVKSIEYIKEEVI
jgi:hypothetical protein